jgi:hypothetical protein
MKRERIKEPLIDKGYVTQFTLAPDDADVARAATLQEDGE